MTETEARQWVRDRFGVSRETTLERYELLLRAEVPRQNLIAASTLDHLWARHFVDSAQLLLLADDAAEGPWVDVGAGAGLPGLVVALLSSLSVVLVEPRAKRAQFLQQVVETLGLTNATIVASRIEAFKPARPAAILSARAVAELSELIASAHHCTDSSTIWLLPKGRNAQSEVAAARRTWQGSFHVEPSITQPDSGIVIARKVRRK